MALSNSIHKTGGWRRGKSPSPKPNRALLPLGRWWGLNLHECVIDLIEITFVYCSQAVLGMGLAGAGGEEWHCKNVLLWKSSRRLRGIPTPPGLLLLPAWPAADPGSDVGRHLTAASLRLPQWKWLQGTDGLKRGSWAWENTRCSWAVSLQYGKLEACLVVTISLKLNQDWVCAVFQCKGWSFFASW